MDGEQGPPGPQGPQGNPGEGSDVILSFFSSNNPGDGVLNLPLQTRTIIFSMVGGGGPSSDQAGGGGAAAIYQWTIPIADATLPIHYTIAAAGAVGGNGNSSIISVPGTNIYFEAQGGRQAVAALGGAGGDAIITTSTGPTVIAPGAAAGLMPTFSHFAATGGAGGGNISINGGSVLTHVGGTAAPGFGGGGASAFAPGGHGNALTLLVRGAGAGAIEDGQAGAEGYLEITAYRY